MNKSKRNKIVLSKARKKVNKNKTMKKFVKLNCSPKNDPNDYYCNNAL